MTWREGDFRVPIPDQLQLDIYGEAMDALYPERTAAIEQLIASV